MGRTARKRMVDNGIQGGIKILNRKKYTDSEIQKIINNMILLVDSREKSNAHLLAYWNKHNIKYEVMGLPAGDYSFALVAVP